MTTVSFMRRLARALALASLILLMLGWLFSLPLGPFVPRTGLGPRAPQSILLEQPSSAASWRDTLLLQITAHDPGVQQRRGLLVWNRERQLYQVPLTLLSDGRAHRYVVPLGIHPGWRGAVRDLRLELAPVAGFRFTIDDLILVQRSPLALDAWLGSRLTPSLPIFPPWPNLVLLTGALLTAGIAVCAWGWSRSRRLAWAALVIGGSSGLITLGSYLSLLSSVLPAYAPQRDVAQRTPMYHESQQINQVLLEAAAHLPNQPVLMIDLNSADYLIGRARYLLYPRRVDVLRSQPRPAQLDQALQAGYAGLIVQYPLARPPRNGWQALSQPDAPLHVWSLSGASAAPARATDTGSLPALLIGMALVVGVGLVLSCAIGWLKGWHHWAMAYPLGVGAVAVWMFGLNVVGIGWSWLSIGLPAALLIAGYLWRRWRSDGLHGRWPRWQMWSRPVQAALLLLVSLTLLLSLHAWAVPFADQDTWTMWGLRGRAWYLDGALAPALEQYGQDDLHHPTYPPAQGLIQTWGYLAMDGLDERLVKVWMPLWYATCLLLLAALMQRWLSLKATLAWTFLLATTPILLDHATLVHADLPLAVTLMLGAGALAQWIEDGRWRALLAASVSLGCAAWLKLDGQYLGVAFLALAGILRGLRCYQRQQRVWHPLLLALGAACGVALMIAPWLIWIRLHGFGSEVPSTNRLAIEGSANVRQGLLIIGEEVALSHNNAPWGLLGGGFGALWLVCGAALISAGRRLLHDHHLLFLTLCVVGGIGFYLAIYIVRPFFSIERYLLHLAPIAVLAAARSTRAAAQ